MKNTAPAEKLPAPVHIGIIMDGNGRWAVNRGLVRTQGHLEGLKAAKRITKAASELGVKYITLYAFSTENWKRASEEVDFIMGLIKQYLRSEFDFSKRNHIRVRFTGNMEGLPVDIQKEITETIKQTAEFDGMQVVLAINYGGRDEIIRALKKFIQTAEKKHEDITENDIHRFLDNPDIPDPDLIIRSAGEYRTSNFLLWEGAYSEIYVSQKLWPDWEKSDLETAIENYQKRERRFGAETGNKASGF
ncbi:MAG: di-trans,poly-cis-decaprenylcistransferase [Treponema sp.]|jgi:undecaprenyl diphosphate synthase|nr:di-trans,poly-cis-decaprenylcistransferase [Treponema sp.]